VANLHSKKAINNNNFYTSPFEKIAIPVRKKVALQQAENIKF
jgi:hypothetical protein